MTDDTKGSREFSHNILSGGCKKYTGLDQLMEFFCFILKFATDRFSNESFNLLLRISNMPHALKVVVIPGFQEFLTIMLLLEEIKGAHHIVIRCLAVLTYLTCLPTFPTDTGTATLTQISLQASPG